MHVPLVLCHAQKIAIDHGANIARKADAAGLARTDLLPHGVQVHCLSHGIRDPALVCKVRIAKADQAFCNGRRLRAQKCGRQTTVVCMRDIELIGHGVQRIAILGCCAAKPLGSVLGVCKQLLQLGDDAIADAVARVVVACVCGVGHKIQSSCAAFV